MVRMPKSGREVLGQMEVNFRVVDEDFVAWKLVFPNVDGGEGVVEAGGGVGVGVAGVLGAHPTILLDLEGGQGGRQGRC